MHSGSTHTMCIKYSLISSDFARKPLMRKALEPHNHRERCQRHIQFCISRVYVWACLLFFHVLKWARLCTRKAAKPSVRSIVSLRHQITIHFTWQMHQIIILFDSAWRIFCVGSPAQKFYQHSWNESFGLKMIQFNRRKKKSVVWWIRCIMLCHSNIYPLFKCCANRCEFLTNIYFGI